MQNKPNFGNDKMNIITTITMDYVISSRWLRRKNKPNSNPIKPITNPIKANTNPIQTQSKPISARAKMNPFAWVRTFTIVLIMLLADFTTLKGAIIVER